jgi:hypothetical protein
MATEAPPLTIIKDKKAINVTLSGKIVLVEAGAGIEASLSVIKYFSFGCFIMDN